MPLLSPEISVYPPDLLSADLSPADGAGAPCGRWWVLHTRPRTEKALARRLLSRAVGFFLPQYEKKSLNQGRLLSSHLPLFPGYLFLHGDDQGRLAALETNLIVNCLPVVDQRQLHADLERVFRLMSSDAPADARGAAGGRRPGGNHRGGADGPPGAGDPPRQELESYRRGPFSPAGRLRRGGTVDDPAVVRGAPA